MVFEGCVHYLFAKSDTVVGPPVFGVYLGCVGKVEALDGGAKVGYALAVVNSNDWLGGVHLMVIILLNPGWVEAGVDPA